MDMPNIKQAVKDLSSHLAERREDALTVILANPQEAAPELLQVLEKVKNIPVGAAVTLNDWSWFLSAYLLAQFRDKRAKAILLEQFTQPAEHVDRLFKDILVEDMPRVLATLCAEDPAALRGLIEDPATHGSVKASALWGYTLLSTLGIVPVGEVTHYYAELFQGKALRKPSYLWTSLVAGAAALHATTLRRDILKAYEENLLDASAYSMKEVLAEWEFTAEESLKRLAEDSGGLIHDVWEEMEYWPWTEEAGREASEE